jgi:ankyrin repeat protein
MDEESTFLQLPSSVLEEVVLRLSQIELDNIFNTCQTFRQYGANRQLNVLWIERNVGRVLAYKMAQRFGLVAYMGSVIPDLTHDELISVFEVIVLTGEAEIVAMILNGPYNINVNTPLPTRNVHPLMMAACEGVFVALLSAPNIDVRDVRDRDRNTPLHHVAMFGYADAMRMLLQLPGGADPINTPNRKGYTPLHCAIWAGRTDEVLQILMEVQGIDLNVRAGPDRFTPLHMAMLRHDEVAVRALAAIPMVDVNLVNTEGSTPLHLAAENNAHTCIVALVELREDDLNVNAQHASNRRTPLHLARTERAVSALLTAKGIDVNLQDILGRTPLNNAVNECGVSHHTFMTLLRAEGVDVNIADTFGDTPLHNAVMRRNVNAVIALLKAPGIDVNPVANNKDTPIHTALRDGGYRISTLLCTAPGIDLTARGEYGRSAQELMFITFGASGRCRAGARGVCTLCTAGGGASWMC